MKTWSSLLRKEYLLNRSLILGVLLIILGTNLLVGFLEYRYDNPYLGIGFCVLLISQSIWYLPVFLFTSLSKEWKSTAPLWLHLPQSGWQLLAAKVLAGLVAMVLTLLFLGLLSIWTAWEEISLILSDYTLPFSYLVPWGAYLAFLLIITSLYMALWAMMASVAMASVKSFLKKGHWLVGLAVLLLPTWGLNTLNQTSFYRSLTHWGAFQIHLPYPETFMEFGKLFTFNFFTGEVLFYLALCAGLFYLAGWLLDHKVEV